MSKILVVEDTSIDRTLIGGLLAKEPNWEIEFANDGQEALDRIAPGSPDHFMPDVIVTDLQMPRIDGLELVRQVRSLYPHVPVVLITSLGSEGLAVKALAPVPPVFRRSPCCEPIWFAPSSKCLK